LFESYEANTAYILLLIVLLLEANDTLSLLENYIVPFTDSTICLNFADRVVILITEADLIDPVLARFDSDLADRAIGR